MKSIYTISRAAFAHLYVLDILDIMNRKCTSRAGRGGCAGFVNGMCGVHELNMHFLIANRVHV